MCFTCKRLCFGYVSLETGSYATGFYKILIDCSLLYLLCTLYAWTPFFTSPTIIFAVSTCIFVILLNMVLLFGILFKNHVILGAWLYIKILILMVITFLLFYVSLVGATTKQNVMKVIQQFYDTTMGNVCVSILFLSTLSGYVLWNMVFSLFEKISNENRNSNNQTNIESNGINQRQLVPVISYLRSLSLPTYENAMLNESSKKLETPPPKYDQISF